MPDPKEGLKSKRQKVVGNKSPEELAVIKQAVDEARDYAENIVDTVREPLLSLDQDLRVVSVSRSFYEFFKVKPEETVGQLIYDLGPNSGTSPSCGNCWKRSFPTDNP